MIAILDANLFLRLTDRTAPQNSIANAAVHSLRQQGFVLQSIPQSLYEFWVVATRPLANNGLGLSVADADTELATIMTFFPLLDDRPGLYAEWRKLVSTHACQGKPAHDARYVAAMNTHGITHLVTLNVTDFSRYPGIIVLDPNAIAAPPTPPVP